jgi:hypothetical protein
MPDVNDGLTIVNAADEIPQALRIFMFYGLDLSWKGGDGRHARGDCPWCGYEGKFNVVIETGLWRCVVCGGGGERDGGNAQTFMELLWKRGLDATQDQAYQDLIAERKLLSVDTPKRWGLCKSILSQHWLCPGFGADGKMKCLYRWTRMRDPKGRIRRSWLVPPGRHHQLMRPTNESGFDWEASKQVVVAEGLWDGMTAEEVVPCYECLVVAAPTAAGLNSDLLPLFSGKKVILPWDNDWPIKLKNVNGVASEQPGAGWSGMRKVCKAFLALDQKERPAEVVWLKWSTDG